MAAWGRDEEGDIAVGYIARAVQSLLTKSERKVHGNKIKIAETYI